MGRNDEQPQPQQVLLPEGAQGLFCGAQHTCATMANGNALCWGHNNFGQLGDPASGNAYMDLAGAGARDRSGRRAGAGRRTQLRAPARPNGPLLGAGQRGAAG